MDKLNKLCKYLSLIYFKYYPFLTVCIYCVFNLLFYFILMIIIPIHTLYSTILQLFLLTLNRHLLYFKKNVPIYLSASICHLELLHKTNIIRTTALWLLLHYLEASVTVKRTPEFPNKQKSANRYLL